MFEMMTAIDHVTPRWLTAMLRRSGDLVVGAVQSVKVVHVHDEQSGSISYVLGITYTDGAGTHLPARLFLKLPRPDSGAGQAIEYEAQMYRALAPYHHHLPIIRCYEARYDPSHQTGYLLLADLSETHIQPAWHLDIAERYVTQTIDCLAQFHSFWRDHPQLGDFGTLPTANDIANEIAELQTAFPGFAAALGDRLTHDDRSIYKGVLAALPTLWAQRMATNGQTLVHGDAHFWNFLYPRDLMTHQTCMIDWQLCHVGHGMEDVAYTIMRYPHRTAASERALVTRYHNRMHAYGVADYDWDTCWMDYRRAATAQLVFPIHFYRHGMPMDFWSLFVPRTFGSFRDLRCTELLDTSPIRRVD